MSVIAQIAGDSSKTRGKDPDHPMAKLMSEAVGFFDQESHNYTSALYKNVTAATLWGDN